MTRLQFFMAMTSGLVALLLIAERRRGEDGARGWGVWLTKPAASLGFIVVALSAGALDTSYGVGVLAALVLSALGDVLLIPKSKATFLAGLVSFLLGHVAYAVTFALEGRHDLGMLGALLGTVVVGTPIARWLLPHVEAKMKGPVVAYMVVISIMVVTAMGLGLAKEVALVPIAAVAFYVSDICVARERFVTRAYANRLVGLPLYYAAQIVFAAST